MNASQVEILLVDDDDVDAEAVERAFRKLKIENPITKAGNGLEALEILRGDSGEQKVSRPFIILLDINMPKMNGHEFLEELRADPVLADSIVFVLTTSQADRDKVEAYQRNVAGYILKSNAGEDFSNLVGLLDRYWRHVELPI